MPLSLPPSPHRPAALEGLRARPHARAIAIGVGSVVFAGTIWAILIVMLLIA